MQNLPSIKCELRSLRKGETDHELLWLLVGTMSLGSAWVWLKLKMPWPSCWFLHTTGFPCLTCGTTRCFLFLTRGKIGSAFMMNPLACLALAGAALFGAYSLVVLLCRLPRVRLQLAQPASHVVRFVFIAAILLNWAYLIASGRF